jgi:hypothetical protein
MAAARKRGYSREFPVNMETRKRYLLDDIPAGMWIAVRAKAKRDGLSLRALVLSLLARWLSGEIAMVAPPAPEAE